MPARVFNTARYASPWRSLRREALRPGRSEEGAGAGAGAGVRARAGGGDARAPASEDAAVDGPQRAAEAAGTAGPASTLQHPAHAHAFEYTRPGYPVCAFTVLHCYKPVCVTPAYPYPALGQCVRVPGNEARAHGVPAAVCVQEYATPAAALFTQRVNADDAFGGWLGCARKQKNGGGVLVCTEHLDSEDTANARARV